MVVRLHGLDEGTNDDYAGRRYEVKSFATDRAQQRRCLRCLFGYSYRSRSSVRADRQKTTSDYVYVMQFTGDKISHMTKIWHSGMALKELGWA